MRETEGEGERGIERGGEGGEGEREREICGTCPRKIKIDRHLFQRSIRAWAKTYF